MISKNTLKSSMFDHTEEIELSLKHLLAELARIDILIQREIQLVRAADTARGIDPREQGVKG